MTLRTAIGVSVALLVAGTVVAAMVAVKVVVDRSARRELEHRLERHGELFTSLLAERREVLAREVRVVADEPRLRAVAASDVDRDTVLGVAAELHATLRSDLFVLLDGGGSLVVDVLDESEWGHDMAAMPLVREAFARGAAAGVWVDDRAVYEVAVQRVHHASRTVGAIAVGHAIDDEVAAALHHGTGTSLVILLGPPGPDPAENATGEANDDAAARGRAGLRVAATSALPGADDATPEDVARALAAVDPDRPAATRVTIDGAGFLARAGRFPGYRGARDLRYVMAQNLDVALAPGQRMARVLHGILAGAMLLGLIVTLLLARRLARPLGELAAFTERIADGDLDARTEVTGVVEVTRLGAAMNQMAGDLAESHRTRAEKQRLENELEIAARIQTSIVPRRTALPGLDIAARMETAESVGGDYYDVLPAPGGGWIAIGDVAGHGLHAGMVMMMAQTSLATLVAAFPDAAPKDQLVTLNRVLYQNVRRRLASDRHMTMSILRYSLSGTLVVAGAHLDVVHLPHDADACRAIEIPGTWLGLLDDVTPVTVDTEIALAPGDLVVLYTDGLIEARNRDGEQFGTARVEAEVVARRADPVEAICQGLFAAAAAFADTSDDDMSAVVMRYRGPDADAS